MESTRIILSGLWGASMLTFLWGDVLTIISGDVRPGLIQGEKVTQGMSFAMAGIMMIPIVMVVLSLTLRYPAIRWVNIVVAILWVLFILSGISGYPAYEKFLLGISIVFNVMTVWHAWKWVV
jgi:hypothetical protein